MKNLEDLNPIRRRTGILAASMFLHEEFTAQQVREESTDSVLEALDRASDQNFNDVGVTESILENLVDDGVLNHLGPKEEPLNYNNRFEFTEEARKNRDLRAAYNLVSSDLIGP